MKIAIYGCGGTGMNLLKQVYAEINDYASSGADFGNISFYSADTSRANDANLPKDVKHWYPEGEDGAGKNFRESHRVVSDPENIASLMKALQPSDVNIILSSAGGGTGPIIATAVSAAILEKGKQPIHIMIGSESSEKEVTNAQKAIAMLNNVGRKYKSYIPLHFASLSNLAQRSMVDGPAVSLATKLAMAFTGDHAELDMSDIRNSLNPVRLFDTIRPGLAFINLVEYDDEKEAYVHMHSPFIDDGAVMEASDFMDTVDSTLTLRRNDDSTPKLALAQLVDGEGFFSSREWDIVVDRSMVFTFSQEYVNNVNELLESNVESYSTAVSRRANKDTDFEGDVFIL